MRPLTRFLGNLLLLLAAAGGALLLLPPSLPLVGNPLEQWPAAQLGGRPEPAPTDQSTEPVLEQRAGAEAEHPIDRVVITSIGLDAVVVEAPRLVKDGGVTWQVPAFAAGHVEGTVGAGARGNAVLLGHVESLHSGNVFHDLERVRPGDVVQLFSAAQRFDYGVVRTQAIPRTDTSILEPGETAATTLVTCTGVWSPFLWDFTERLAVRAELLPPGPG